MLNASVAKLALRLEEEQEKLDKAATRYLAVSEEIRDTYNIKITNELIKAKAES